MGLAMFGQHISVSKLAKELLFDGYEDPLLDLAKSLPPSTTGGAPPVDRFGWFYEVSMLVGAKYYSGSAIYRLYQCRYIWGVGIFSER